MKSQRTSPPTRWRLAILAYALLAWAPGPACADADESPPRQSEREEFLGALGQAWQGFSMQEKVAYITGFTEGLMVAKGLAKTGMKDAYVNAESACNADYVAAMEKDFQRLAGEMRKFEARGIYLSQIIGLMDRYYANPRNNRMPPHVIYRAAIEDLSRRDDPVDPNQPAPPVPPAGAQAVPGPDGTPGRYREPPPVAYPSNRY